jgi:hypothetical protein
VEGSNIEDGNRGNDESWVLVGTGCGVFALGLSGGLFFDLVEKFVDVGKAVRGAEGWGFFGLCAVAAEDDPGLLRKSTEDRLPKSCLRCDREPLPPVSRGLDFTRCGDRSLSKVHLSSKTSTYVGPIPLDAVS